MRSGGLGRPLEGMYMLCQGRLTSLDAIGLPVAGEQLGPGHPVGRGGAAQCWACDLWTQGLGWAGPPRPLDVTEPV